MPSLTDIENAYIATINAKAQPQNDALGTMLSQYQRTENKSALGTIDRLKYGFADDWGKRKIIQDAGYTQDQIVSLKNGEYGVKIPGVGIRPIDPKGFKVSDIAGDIAESVGKSLPTIGGATGATAGLLGSGGVASSVGAGVGSGAGEFVRQQIGNLIGVRNLNDNSGYKELAAEAVFGVGGQAIALGGGKLLGALLAPGSKAAVTTEVANVIGNKLGMRNVNSDIIKRGFKGEIIENLDDLALRTDTQLKELIENKNKLLFKKYLEPELQKVAQAQGVSNADDVLINVSGTKTAIDDVIKNVNTSKSILPSQKKQILSIAEDVKGSFDNGAELTYGQFKESANNLYELAQSARKNNDFTSAKTYSKLYDALTDSRAQSLSPEAFASYSQERKALGKLDKLFRVKLSEGELQQGQQSLVAKLVKMTDEVRQAPRYNELQSIIAEAKNIGIEGIDDLSNNIDSLLFNYGLSKAKIKPGPLGKITGSIPGVSGVGKVISEPFTDAYNQARILKGLFSTGVLDESKMSAKVAEGALSNVQSLAQLVNAKRLIDSGTPLSTVTKIVPKSISKAIKKVAPGIPGQIMSKSLNRIVYGNTQ